MRLNILQLNWRKTKEILLLNLKKFYKQLCCMITDKVKIVTPCAYLTHNTRCVYDDLTVRPEWGIQQADWLIKWCGDSTNSVWAVVVTIGTRSDIYADVNVEV